MPVRITKVKMKYKVLMMLAIVALMLIPLSCVQPQQEEPPQDWVVANEAEFLAKCEQYNISFERYDSGGDTIDYYYQRMIGNATVERDSINYQFDKDTGILKKKLVHWRGDLPDTLPPIISQEQAMSIGGGTEACLFYISPDSAVSLVKPTPTNPCWVVYIYEDYHDPETNETFTYNSDVIVVDAVTGEILGHGIPEESPPFPPPVEDTATAPSSPIGVDLSISNAPALNATAEITCTITSVFDAPNTSAQIILPDGFKLVSGELSWQGDIAPNGQESFKFTIKSVKTGNWTIEAKAGYLFGEDGWYGNIDDLYISVSEETALVSKTPFLSGNTGMRRLDDSQIPSMVELPPQGITPTVPEEALETTSFSSSGTLNVTGKFWCYVSEDALPSLGQQRSDVMVPIVWGSVKIYDGNNTLLGSDITGPKGSIGEGEFEISVENPGSTGFYVLIAPWTSIAHVCKQDGTDYWTRAPLSGLFYPAPSDTKYYIGSWVISDDYRGAWRIYETIANDHYDRGAWDFLVNEGPGWTPPEITICFPSNRTRYNATTHKVDIQTEDYTKALDVVQHEYGHAVMHKVYSYYWPPTYCPADHYMNVYSHPNCAWTEGWADFFPLMVQSYGRWQDPVFEWGTGSQIDLETPTWGTPGWNNGEGVEGRVAGSLWDIFDSTNDGYDTFTDGFLNIWDVVSTQTDNNFAEFWDAWKAKGHNIPKANAAIYQNTIVYVNGTVVGETRDVNSNLLSNVEVSLYKYGDGLYGGDMSSPDYCIVVNRTGDYWLLGEKSSFYKINTSHMVMMPPLHIDLTTPEKLAKGYVFDFEGNYGLVPRACTMSYAMKSVNLWIMGALYPAEYRLAEWKAMDSIHSWQYPT
jgi:hypothetical protein